MVYIVLNPLKRVLIRYERGGCGMLGASKTIMYAAELIAVHPTGVQFLYIWLSTSATTAKGERGDVAGFGENKKKPPFDSAPYKPSPSSVVPDYELLRVSHHCHGSRFPRPHPRSTLPGLGWPAIHRYPDE
jgi:hypothetical protein